MATLELSDNDITKIADAIATKLIPMLSNATKSAGNRAAKAAAGNVLTLRQAAEMLGISEQTARRMANAGSLTGAYKTGGTRGHWRVKRSQLMVAIRNNRIGTDVREG